MTSRYSPALCACGAPATPSSIQAGKKRCLDCSMAVVAQAAREMHAKSGPAWEAWQTNGGARGFDIARSSPRVHAARLANIAKAQAANSRRRNAAARSAGAVPVVDSPAVQPDITVPKVPPVIFVSPG